MKVEALKWLLDVKSQHQKLGAGGQWAWAPQGAPPPGSDVLLCLLFQPLFWPSAGM